VSISNQITIGSDGSFLNNPCGATFTFVGFPGATVPRTQSHTVRVVLAALSELQRRMVETSLAAAGTATGRAPRTEEFHLSSVEGRGISILREARNADVVLFALEEEVLPGEASHVLASYPDVRIIGLDEAGRARVVVGAVTGPLSEDLVTVIRWITRRNVDEARSDSTAN
jgi:hypothetical protein